MPPGMSQRERWPTAGPDNEEPLMFRHTDYLQFDAQPEKPDPVYAHKLQELIGGAYGEMTVTMQYLFQGW
ncbi:MAG TPA: manganese catalase family protein, partial [Streptosporangiaceae bacterium]|nr:manganese catalase family protein [Streptosporangiaceae bacterium]